MGLGRVLLEDAVENGLGLGGAPGGEEGRPEEVGGGAPLGRAAVLPLQQPHRGVVLAEAHVALGEQEGRGLVARLGRDDPGRLLGSLPELAGLVERESEVLSDRRVRGR